MSFNLVELIKNELGDVVIDQISNILGESKENTGKAVSSAISGVLENILSSSSKEGGATNLSNSLDSMDDSLLGNFSGLISGDNHSSLIETGTKLLGTLLGEGAISKIVSSIAEFSGIQNKSATSLIGLIAPVILAVIGNKMRSDKLDANGLLSMLEGQKGNITQAKPVDMQRVLDTASSQKKETYQPPIEETKPKSGFGKIFLWLPLILLLGIVAYFLPKLANQDNVLDSMQTSDPISSIEDAVSDIESEPSDYVNIGSDLGNIVNTVTDTLGSVTDAESATAALPQITEATSKIDTLSEVFSKLPGPAKSTISSLAENKIITLQPLVDRVVEIPAVGPILKPAIDTLIQKLASFSEK